jgi:transcriptional regulator with XRE-family HTH domain
MDLVRFGRGIRALRLRRGWRQRDLAAAAKVSPTMIARIERGDGTVQPKNHDAVAAALGARTELRLSYNGEALDRMLDAGHAALVDAVAVVLRRFGWDIVIEATFWIRGERGSVDVLAWHPATRTVLVVEVKSVVPDVQAMLSSIDRKVRLAHVIARERGWIPVAVGAVLVIGEDRTARRRIDAHAAIFEQSFPQRAIAVRRWLAHPDATSPLRGLWFLSARRSVTPRHRVRGLRHAAAARAGALEPTVRDTEPPSGALTILR